MIGVTGLLLREDIQVNGLDSHLPLAWDKTLFRAPDWPDSLKTLLHDRLILVYPP